MPPGPVPVSARGIDRTPQDETVGLLFHKLGGVDWHSRDESVVYKCPMGHQGRGMVPMGS